MSVWLKNITQSQVHRINFLKSTHSETVSLSRKKLLMNRAQPSSIDSTDTHRELLKAVITASIGEKILLRLDHPLPGMPIPL